MIPDEFTENRRAGVNVKTHSFFMKLFVSFAILTVIPVMVIYGISNRQIVSYSENAIGRNRVENLKTADKSIEQMQESLYKDCVSLSLNNYLSDMNSYNNNTGDFSGDELINIFQVLDVLRKIAQTDERYYSIYLYLDNFAYTFTTDHDLVANTSLTDTGWLQYYNNYKTQQVPVSFTNTHALVVSKNGTPDSRVYVTTYLYPLTHYTTTLDGAVAVNVKESVISKMINSDASGRNGIVRIIDDSGTVISDIDSGMLTKNIAKEAYIRRILKSKQASGYFSSRIGATTYMISYYRSGINGWIYVGMAPLSSLMNNQNMVSRDTMLITFSIMILGVFIAFMVSKKIYDPVDTMVKTIKSSKMANLIENDDEMSMIHKALSAVSKSDGKYPEKDRKKLRENGIIKLIGDDLTDEESKNALREFFTYDGFVCAVVSLDKYNETTENYEEKRWGYIKTLLLELAAEMLGENRQCVGCTVKKGEITLVFNMESRQSQECLEDLQTGFGRFQAEVAKLLDNSVTVGIGKCCVDLTGIRETYIEAETAMKQKLRQGLGHIILWNDEWSSSSYYYPFEEEEQIRNYLDLGMKEELTAKVRELAESLKKRPRLSCENIIQIATQLAGNTIIKYMIEHHISSNDVYGLNFNIYSEVAHMETLDEIRDMLIDKYTTLIDYFLQSGNRKKNVDAIVEYIGGHYKKDIGINDISEYVGLSYSYVRKIFKDEIDMNILDYINSMRIRDAKCLLKNRDLSIKSIAMSLGYNNNQSFERYFKKLVGVTPGEFRSKMV